MKIRFCHRARKKRTSETIVRKMNQESNINNVKLSRIDQEMNQPQTLMKILRCSKSVFKSEQDNYVIIKHFR